MKGKRSYPRFNTVVKVQDIATLKTGRTKDLSLGGCLINKAEGFDFLPMASRISLKLEIPGVGEPVVVHGIVRHRGKYREGFGVQFEAVDKKAAYYIERFIGTFL